MSILIFANNAQTTLAGALSNSSTTMTLSPGTGSKFPNPTGAQYFTVTLVDASTGLINEICWCTSRSGDTLTVIRGQEGTTARPWLIGDFVNNFPTAGTQNTFTQADQIQKGTYGYTIASGTANALSGTVLSDLTSLPDGMPVILRASYANTNVATFQLTLGSTLLSAYPIVKGNNSPLVAGDIPAAGYQIQLNWSFTFNSWIMQNPATGVSTIPVGSIYQFPCAASAAPSGFLIANGALVSRTTYASLWAFAQASGNIVSEGTWGSGNEGAFSMGDGSTNFRIPQYSGYFLRSLDTGSGIDPGRTIGTVQNGQNVSHSHGATSTTTANSSSLSSGTATSLVTDNGHAHSKGVDLTSLWNGGSNQYLGNGNSSFSGGGSSNFGYGGAPYPTNAANTGISVATTIAVATTTNTTATTSTAISNSGGSETRPINVSVLTCIKT